VFDFLFLLLVCCIFVAFKFEFPFAHRFDVLVRLLLANYCLLFCGEQNYVLTACTVIIQHYAFQQDYAS
jgi:hypothetical protein